jgi:hypothetical protein
MVALLFTAIFIIGLLALTLYFWAPRAKDSEHSLLPPPNQSHGLFSDTDESAQLLTSAETGKREVELNAIRERAGNGDKTTLLEAHGLGDRHFYNEVLDRLTANADRGPTVLALLSYVTRNDLPVNRRLAETAINSWQNSPDRSSTATTLHVAALADDVDLFRSTVESALSFWQQGKLADVSAAELKALFDGEFWLLSTGSRSSGAGFVLKRALANARRELETAMSVTEKNPPAF